MAENIFNSAEEPQLRHIQTEPKGVLHGNLKMLVYLGAAVLVIVAAVFSAVGKKNPTQTKSQPPQPMVQDNTDSNAQELKNQIPTEPRATPDEARTNAHQVIDPDYAPGGRYFGCAPASHAPRKCGRRTHRRGNSPQNSSKSSSWRPRSGS